MTWATTLPTEYVASAPPARWRLAAVATLALGLGATTTIVSVAHTLLAKPLRYGGDPERLVRLFASTPNPVDPAAPPRRVPLGFSAEEARDLDLHAALLDGAGLWSPSVVTLVGVENAGHVSAARLSAATLALLDARPLLGRTIEPGDEAAGQEVALLGYRLWQRLFAGDPGVVGRTLTVQTVLGARASRPIVVIGVMPATFAFPAADTALWLPLPRPTGPQPVRAGLLARLAVETTPAAALAEIDGRVRALRGHGPEVRYELVRERDQLVGAVRPALLVLAATATVLLLIACLNVANLLLARALSRSREFSVRVALGASRGRLIRQILAESALLGVAGGAGGVVLAGAGLAAFRTLAASLPRIDLGTTGVGWGPTAFPRLDDVALDPAVLAGAAALALLAGLGGGVAAALRASRADIVTAARQAGAAATGASSTPLRRGLVVLQVAGAMTLLVGAVLLTRSLQHLTSTDPGYLSENVLTFQVALPATTYPDARLLAFAETLTAQVSRVPGVAAAGYANQLPMVALRDTAGGLWSTPDATRKGSPDAADARFVSRDYFGAMGIQVVAGRGFAAGDGAGQPRVLLVNQALARRELPGRDPIGLPVYVGRDTAPWTIVGVVSDVRQFGLDRAPEPQFFVDLRQWSGGMPLFPTGAYYVAKTHGPPEALVPALRALVRDLDGEAALFNVAPMETIVAATVTRPRLYARIIGALAVLGALLSAIGVYGVLAFLVHERTGELGIRMALGASRAAVLALVLRQGGTLVIGGLLLGAAGAAALTRTLGGLLYGVRPADPVTYVVAAGLFAVLAATAVIVPARRATRVDPMVALRRE